MFDGPRHDDRIAAAGATESPRRTAQVVSDAFAPGIVMECSPMEVSSLGIFPMLYANPDTGNTAIGFSHLRSVYESLATHLYKNGRWALLQPSCMVVGLPGTIDEAQVRATYTFMSAGHVDIGDDLTTLPEDRWRVLLSVLPQNDVTATPIDLFHPVRVSEGDDVATTEPQGACVWHVPVDGGWDQWHLVAVFNLADPTVEREVHTRRFEIPFEHIGLSTSQRYWATEFWSGQFLGSVPVAERAQGSYRHPGDEQTIIHDGKPGMLDVSFCPPAVKLLIIRKPRRHPWPVATTFHQSGGRELRDVKWHAKRRTLAGELHRPVGHSGQIIIAGAKSGAKATVGGRRAAVLPAANGAIAIPITTQSDVTAWSVKW
jgi:hypothetical protein